MRDDRDWYALVCVACGMIAIAALMTLRAALALAEAEQIAGELTVENRVLHAIVIGIGRSAPARGPGSAGTDQAG